MQKIDFRFFKNPIFEACQRLMIMYSRSVKTFCNVFNSMLTIVVHVATVSYSVHFFQYEDPNVHFFQYEDPNVHFFQYDDPNVHFFQYDDPNVYFFQYDDPNVYFIQYDNPQCLFLPV